MSAVRLWWGHVVAIVTGTFGSWWRTLPRVLAATMAGWLGYNVCTQVAMIIAINVPWLSLFVFALGLVTMLAGIVMGLRYLGDDLGIQRLVEEHDDRNASVGRMLAITLLPFLGIYATFGEIQTRVTNLNTLIMLRYGIDKPQLLDALNFTKSPQAAWTVVGVIVGTYVVRRGVDLLHEKTDFRPLGLVAAYLEGFFMMCLLLAAGRATLGLRDWLTDRVVAGWVEDLTGALARGFSQLKIDLPQVWQFLGDAWSNWIWPLVSDVVFLPVLWLAVAALIYGSHVLSLAEMWRKGEPLAATLRPGATASRGKRRRAALEIQEAFFGDLDDKYIPTWQSLKLIFRAGMPFLGAYVLLFTVMRAFREWVVEAPALALAGRDIWWWDAVSPTFAALTTAITEPLRLALLAAAFYRCLSVWHERSEAAEHRQLGRGAASAQAVAAPAGAVSS